jgi:predicted DNA-binding transcriptional regulator YafY
MEVRTPNGPRFPPRERPAEDIGAYVTRSIRSAPSRQRARVTVDAPAAVIAERVPRDVVVEPVDDNTCALEVGAGSVEMLAMYLGMLEADFTVTEPAELVERLRLLARRFGRAVSADGA